MKKILLITLVAAFVLSSCKEESLGVSFVVTYPIMTLTGDEALTIPLGGTYVEKGCVVKEGTTDLSSLVKISGTVNSAVAGVYTINYTYKNAGKIYPQDSLTLTATRFVGVITPAASAMDISGQYQRNAGALGVATIAKTAYPGLYINDNPGGIAMTGSNQIFFYMFQTDATVLKVPVQNTAIGTMSCTGGVYDATGAKPLYKWVVVNSGYGTAVRTFIKL